MAYDPTESMTNNDGATARPAGMFDRLPPQNIEAEQGVIGSIFLDNAVMHDVAAILKPEDFFRDAHQVIYREALAIYDRGKPFDVVILAEAMGDRYRAIDGDRLMSTIIGAVPHAAHAVHYAGIVRQKARSRALIECANEILRDGYSNDFTADQLIEAAERRVFAVADDEATGDTLEASEVVTLALARLEDRERGEASGIETGFADLDDLTDGLLPGNLIIVAARPSVGKAQPLDALVLTPGGFIPMGDVNVGDEVIGSGGKPCRVIGVYPQGELPVYRVTMSDGGSTQCCEEHLWSTQTRNERRRGISGSVKSLKKIMGSLTRASSNSPNHAIPIVAPVEFFDGPALDLDPYAMGLLLGDGMFTSGNIIFSNPEPDLQRRLAEVLPDCDALVIGDDDKDCRIKRTTRNNDISATKRAISRYGLLGKDSCSKFIPIDYMSASIEERTLLLRGLMDTDGGVTSWGQSVEYSTSSPALATDVANLARSLGGVVSTRARIPVYTYKGESLEGEESFRMVLYFPNGLTPVSSEKHLSLWRWKRSRDHRSIVDVEPVGYKQCQCIKVDAEDELYVTDDYIVTHNTSLALNIAEFASTTKGVATLLVSLEMNRIEVGERLISSYSRVDNYRLKNPDELSRRDREAIYEADVALRRSRMFIDDTPVRTVTQIAANARRLRSRHNLGLVIVDYIQLIEGQRLKGESRQEEVARVSKRLKGLARELDLPVVCLAQLNRESERRDDRRPRLADLRESGQIEADADVVILLHRPDLYDPNDRPGEADMIVAKNRNGATGTVRLVYLKHCTRFESMAPHIPPPADVAAF